MSDDRSWFWNQGYDDAIGGALKLVPDEARTMSQRNDYFAGWEAGLEDSSFIDTLTTGGLEIPEEMLDEEERLEKEGK
jgi:hypothetical protein